MRRFLIAALALAGCTAAPATAKLVRWHVFARAKAPVDIVGPRADGSLVLAVARGLATLGPKSCKLSSARCREPEPMIYSSLHPA